MAKTPALTLRADLKRLGQMVSDVIKLLCLCLFRPKSLNSSVILFLVISLSKSEMPIS